MREFPERFGSCVPHTTRARRENEVKENSYLTVTGLAKYISLIFLLIILRSQAAHAILRIFVQNK
jgi:hypothetical protein